MPSVLPGYTPDDEEDPYTDEGYPPAYEAKGAKFPSKKFPSIPKKAAKRPFWYNVDYWEEGTLRKRREKTEATFGPFTAEIDPVNALYNNRAIHFRAVANNVDPHAYADYLARRYPGMSPSMLAALVQSGLPPDDKIIGEDGIAWGASLDKKRSAPNATTFGTGVTGLRYDYDTKGTVEIDGTQVKVGEDQAIIRDAGGQAVHVFTVGKPTAKEGDSASAYNWLKGLSRNFFGFLSMPVSGIQATWRNVAKDLSDGKPAEALLSLAEFVPAVSAITEWNNPENINPWEQTEFGQTILAVTGQRNKDGVWVPGNLAGGTEVDQGDGFFIAPDSQVGIAAREAAIDAYEVNGEAWTYGRGLAASLDMDPDSIAYSMLSGTVDLGMALVTDPTIWMAGLGLPSRAAAVLTKTSAARALSGGKIGPEGFLFGKAAARATAEEQRTAAVILGMEKIDSDIARLSEEVDKAGTVEDAARFNDELAAKHADLLEYEQQLRDLGVDAETARAYRDAVKAEERTRQSLLQQEMDNGRLLRDAKRRESEAQLLANATMDTGYVDTLGQYQEAVSRLQQIEHRVETAVGLGPDAYSVPDLSASLTRMADNLGLDAVDEQARQLAAQGGSMYGLRTKMPPPGALRREAPLEPVPGMFDEGQQVVAYWRPQDGAYRPPNLLDSADTVPAELLDSLSARIADPVRGPGRPTRPLAEIRAEAAANPADWKVKRVENGSYEAPNGAAIRRADDGSWEVYRPGSAEPVDIHRTLPEAKAALDDLRTAADEEAFLTAREAATPTTLSLNTLRARLRKMGVLDTPYGQAMLNSAQDQLDNLDELLTLPGLTVERLTSSMDDMGLLPHLDIELKNLGFDGIAGVGRREGDNGFIWWGDNPDIDVYGARLSRMARDTEISLSPTRIDERGMPVGDIGLILDDAGELRAAADATRQQADLLARRVADIEQQAADGRMMLDEAQAEVAALNAQRAQIAAEAEAIAARQQASRVSGPQAMLERRKQLMEARDRLAREVGRHEKNGVLRTKNLEVLAAKNEERLQKLSDLEMTREAMKRRLGAEEGVFGNRAINYDLLRKGIFGSGLFRGNETTAKALKALANIDPEDVGRVMLLTKNKWPIEVYKDLVDNAAMTVDQARVQGVKEMFKEGSPGALGSGTEMLDDAAAEVALAAYKEKRVLEILTNPMGVRLEVGWNAARELAAHGGEAPAAFNVTAKMNAAVFRASRIIPGSLRVSLSDGQDLAQKLDYYAIQMRKGDEYRADLFKRIFEISGSPEMEGAARNLLVGVMNDLIQSGTDQVMATTWGQRNPQRANLINAKLREHLQVWNREVGDSKAYYQYAQGDGIVDIPSISLIDGEQIPMTNAHLEQEFANGNVFLPDPRHFYRLTQRTSRYLESMKSTALAFEVTDAIVSDYWRSLVLIRPAYMVRNIAEMEIRNFLAGELNIFSNPFQIMGMVFGKQDGRNPLSKLDRYTHDVAGREFLKRVPDDLDDEALAFRSFHDRYMEIIDIHNGSISDPRLYNTAATRGGMVQVSPGEARFNEAWALELMRLDRDTASRLVLRGSPDGKDEARIAEWVANGFDEATARQEAVLDWAFTTDAGEAWRNRLGGAGGPSFMRIAEDREAMRQYLFTWEKSVANRVRDYTNGDERLLGFLRDRALVGEDGTEIAAWPKGKTPDDIRDGLRDILTTQFKDVELNRNLKIWAHPPSARQGMPSRLVSAFFRQAAKMERLGVMGPEYRYAYWKKIDELSPYMTVEAKRQAAEHAQASLLNLTRAGKPFQEPARMAARIGDMSKAGPMTLEDAHSVASKHAGDLVGGLYYDATQRNNFFQATRLAMPFGQAWFNSFQTWTELAAKNPVQVYRAQRAMNAALEADSSTIYDAMSTNPGEWGQDREMSATKWYDPNQGLVQFDDFGEPIIYIPGIGTAMSGLGNLFGQDMPTQMSGFRLKGLNLLTAGSDSPLPPVGPAVTIPAAAVMDRLSTKSEFLYEYLFPYGEPSAANGIFEAVSPAWMRRFLAVIQSPDNQYRLQNLKPAMAHLVQNGNHDLSSEAGKQAFLDEATGLTAWMTLATAIGQAFLPTTPVSKYQFENESGERLAMTAVSNLFYDQYLPAFGDDYEQAWSAFFDDFGVQGLISITSTTDSPVGSSIKDDAWKVMREFPDLAVAYPEEMATLFPGGERSISAMTWQKERGDRLNKKPREVLDDIYRALYRLQRGGIDKKASELGWPDERKDVEIERLERSWQATGKPGYSGGMDPAVRVGKIESFILDNPQIADMPTANLFILAVQERDDILAEMDARGIDSKTMSSRKASPYQRRYFAFLDMLTEQDKNFSEAARLLRKEQS